MTSQSTLSPARSQFRQDAFALPPQPGDAQRFHPNGDTVRHLAERLREAKRHVHGRLKRGRADEHGQLGLAADLSLLYLGLKNRNLTRLSRHFQPNSTKPALHMLYLHASEEGPDLLGRRKAPWLVLRRLPSTINKQTCSKSGEHRIF